MTTNDYYEYGQHFDMEVTSGKMPKDVKRVIRHGNNTYNDRYYFFSASERSMYKYFTSYGGIADRMNSYPVSKVSIRFQLIPDEDDGTPNTPNKRDSIYVSDRFIRRVEGMNKIELDRFK